MTFRGVRELVLVGGASGNLYAVDADLGTIFWKRHFDGGGHKSCGNGPIATPAIEPELVDPDDAAGEERQEDDDDEPGPMRPIYAVSSDGRLHTVRPSDGADTAAPSRFLPPNAASSSLNLSLGGTHKWVYTTTSGGCGNTAEGVWTIDLMRPGSAPHFFSANGVPPDDGVALGFDGAVYSASGSKVLSLSAGSLKLKHSFSISDVTAAPIVFRWGKRDMIAAGGKQGRLALFQPGKAQAEAYADGDGAIRGLATYRDPSGFRWIFATVGSKIEAFKLTGTSDEPRLNAVWSSRDLPKPGTPALMNGIVFVLAGGAKSDHAILYALDSATGNTLYSSDDAITSFAQTSGLAIANGHISFVTSDSVLYCFGLPLDR